MKLSIAEHEIEKLIEVPILVVGATVNGYLNQTATIDTKNGRFVVKMYGDAPGGTASYRANTEYRALVKCAANRLNAPQPVKYFNTVLVTTWLRGRPISELALRDAPFGLVLAWLDTFHRLQSDDSWLEMGRTNRALASARREIDRIIESSCASTVTILSETLECLADSLSSYTVPSHGDASLHNWFYDGEILYASDLECCGLAHPTFDFGHLAASVLIRSAFARRGWALIRELLSLYRQNEEITSNDAAIGILCGLTLSAAAAPLSFRQFILEESVASLPLINRL